MREFCRKQHARDKAGNVKGMPMIIDDIFRMDFYGDESYNIGWVKIDYRIWSRGRIRRKACVGES